VFTNSILGAYAQTLSHGAIQALYAMFIVDYSDQIRNGVKGGFPLLLGPDDILFGTFLSGEIEKDATNILN
jgi:hypothetical protein